MAASMVFGLMAGTVLILFLVPVFYRIYVATYEITTGLPFKIKGEITDETLAAEPPAASVDQITEKPVAV